MHFEPATVRPLWDWHYLQDTVERWHTEGLPENVYLSQTSAARPAVDADAKDSDRISIVDYFGLDRGQPYCQGALAYVPVNTGMIPPCEVQYLHEDQETQTLIDAEGVKKQILKGVVPAMPRFLSFPVKAWEDFQQIQARYDPDSPGRYPDQPEWEAFKANVEVRGYPLGMIFDGFFGRLRRWMGLEALLLTLYDDPGFFEAMCVFHAEFILQTIERAVREVQIDYVNIWEDMAFKNGPLMSPAHVRKYILPGYKQIVDLLRTHGIDIIFVDCDGNVDLLIPIWLEAGINGVWPLEVAAGSDPLRLREEYEHDLLLVGGIDKRELSKGQEQIYAEVMRQVPHLNQSGGYIPTVDHSVPPDVPLENYRYFRYLLAELA
jgi:uroporphyrinogen decarboxylase